MERIYLVGAQTVHYSTIVPTVHEALCAILEHESIYYQTFKDQKNLIVAVREEQDAKVQFVLKKWLVAASSFISCVVELE